MTMEPLRAGPVSGSTVNVTTPGPFPLAVAIVTHCTCLVASHVHPGRALTEMLPTPPAGGAM